MSILGIVLLLVVAVVCTVAFVQVDGIITEEVFHDCKVANCDHGNFDGRVVRW